MADRHLETNGREPKHPYFYTAITAQEEKIKEIKKQYAEHRDEIIRIGDQLDAARAEYNAFVIEHGLEGEGKPHKLNLHHKMFGGSDPSQPSNLPYPNTPEQEEAIEVLGGIKSAAEKAAKFAPIMEAAVGETALLAPITDIVAGFGRAAGPIGVICVVVAMGPVMKDFAEGKATGAQVLAKLATTVVPGLGQLIDFLDEEESKRLKATADSRDTAWMAASTDAKKAEEINESEDLKKIKARLDSFFEDSTYTSKDGKRYLSFPSIPTAEVNSIGPGSRSKYSSPQSGLLYLSVGPSTTTENFTVDDTGLKQARLKGYPKWQLEKERPEGFEWEQKEYNALKGQPMSDNAWFLNRGAYDKWAADHSVEVVGEHGVDDYKFADAHEGRNREQHQKYLSEEDDKKRYGKLHEPGFDNAAFKKWLLVKDPSITSADFDNMYKSDAGIKKLHDFAEEFSANPDIYDVNAAPTDIEDWTENNFYDYKGEQYPNAPSQSELPSFNAWLKSDNHSYGVGNDPEKAIAQWRASLSGGGKTHPALVHHLLRHPHHKKARLNYDSQFFLM